MTSPPIAKFSNFHTIVGILLTASCGYEIVVVEGIWYHAKMCKGLRNHVLVYCNLHQAAIFLLHKQHKNKKMWHVFLQTADVILSL